MEKRESIKRLVLMVLIGCCLVSVLLLSLHFSNKELYFPPLPHGTYSGVIEGFEKVELPEEDKSNINKSSKNNNILRKDVTFFIERKEGKALATLVIFKEGWTPKVVKLQRLESDLVDSVGPASTNKLTPIKFKHQDVVYTLHGKVEDGLAKGYLQKSTGEVLKWHLGILPENDFNAPLPADETTYSQLKKWLNHKSVYRDFLEQVKNGDDLKNEQENRLAKLEKYFKNEEILKNLAKEKENEIKSEIELAKANKENRKTEIKNLIRQLHILARVKERGKIVRSLRRLSAREDSWYRKNWKAETAASTILKHMGGSSRVSMRELDRQFKEAQGVQYIKNQIRQERIQIKELKEEIESFVNEPNPVAPIEAPQLSSVAEEASPSKPEAEG